MLSIQPRRRRKRNEKLTTIRVRPAVRHAQDASSGMLKRSVDLVFEFLTVNGATSPACACRVAGLNHEGWDDTVEDDVVVVAALRECPDVLAGLWGVVVVELEGDGTLRNCQ